MLRSLIRSSQLPLIMLTGYGSKTNLVKFPSRSANKCKARCGVYTSLFLSPSVFLSCAFSLNYSDYLRFETFVLKSVERSLFTSLTLSMSRSRSRSRVSDVMYDSYRTERTGAAAGDTYFSSYSGSRPSSSYLYGHSYSNYHEGITTQNRLLDKDSYCTTPKLRVYF